ncbi:ArnT family glycosyltransferase [Halorussus marinus]|uniref:ArnT family glycosyltransferase n=1 Tax=Halorussus marinus TaxID=2505976 RepID=UPI00106E9C07|nr:hypothetical protein [Halorussus marinus]
MNRRRFRLLSTGLAALSGLVVFVLATDLFPYHTLNHDEGVYLQQAAMLLDGELFLRPPVSDAFRPWFFVEDAGRLYPKYSPVPAAMFAVGELLGGYRIALALVAAGIVGLATLLASAAFDRPTGLLAGAFVLASPLFLVDSSVFLPYAPTTFWNLLFAVAYVRAARAAASGAKRRTYGYAALAGLGVGVAFFARPYTAVLFATPFIAHACYSVVAGLAHGRALARRALARLAPTAFVGLSGVGTALAYNAVVTGSAWLFPYEAFAPRDGLGFGDRRILGHALTYTPEVALEANAKVVATLFGEWVVAAPLGGLLAAVGLGAFGLRAVDRAGTLRARLASDRAEATRQDAGTDPDRSPALTDLQLQAVLAGLFVSVIAGNVYFWGNFNILGDLADPDDGLVSMLGPYYHFDLLVPTAAFGAHAVVLGFGRARDLAARTARPRASLAAVGLAGALVLAGAAGAAAAPPLSANAEVTDRYERAYQPFEDRELSNAVVFVPTPYGDWLGHPFQHLRNDPGFDGETVYAIDDGPERFAVTDAHPNRTYYRYAYRGQWSPTYGDPVEPTLREVRTARGEAVGVAASFGLPPRADRVSARLSTDEGTAYYATNATPATLSVDLRVTDGSAGLAGPAVSAVGDERTVPVAGADEVVLQVFVSDATGGGFSYRLELPVRSDGGEVLALSPYREACLVADRCGGEAAYVEDAMPSGITVETSLYGTTNGSDS